MYAGDLIRFFILPNCFYSMEMRHTARSALMTINKRMITCYDMETTKSRKIAHSEIRNHKNVNKDVITNVEDYYYSLCTFRKRTIKILPKLKVSLCTFKKRTRNSFKSKRFTLYI